MRAMILAAGFGTRLHPLTQVLPKPLVPVMGRPLIEHTIRMLHSWGIRELAINLHHLPEAIPECLGDGSRLGVAIQYIVEEGTIRGTGGGIRGAREILDDGETCLVLNGDVLFEPRLDEALELHRRVGGLATLVLREDSRAHSFGALQVDQKGFVRSLLGKPQVLNTVLTTTMFTGVHLLEPEIFDLLPPEGCIVRQVYRPLLDRGDPLGGFVDHGPWVELGTVSEYHKVNLDLLRGRLVFEGLPQPPADALLIEPDAHVASNVTITPPAYIGAGAIVKADVERSILWSGTRIDEPVRDAVVIPNQVVSAHQHSETEPSPDD